MLCNKYLQQWGDLGPHVRHWSGIGWQSGVEFEMSATKLLAVIYGIFRAQPINVHRPPQGTEPNRTWLSSKAVII
jgi:hypothetical protein